MEHPLGPRCGARTWGPDGPRLLALVDERLRPELLAHGPGVGRDTHPVSARTYLGDGTGLAWTAAEPQVAFSVDAELLGQRVPPRLLRTPGAHTLRDRPGDEFWQRWTLLEAVVKLLDVPMLTWIGRHGLAEPGPELPGLDGRSLAVRTVLAGPLVVSAGALAGADRRG